MTLMPTRLILAQSKLNQAALQQELVKTKHKMFSNIPMHFCLFNALAIRPSYLDLASSFIVLSHQAQPMSNEFSQKQAQSNSSR
jgi:hypothetical protein